MSTSTFRQTVADVAARAKAILPPAVNGRVESAIALVLAHDVLFLDNGTVEVGSASDPLKVHVLTGATCDCADFPRAPESWCKHRLAAGIAKRVQQELARQPEPEPEIELPADFEPYPDNDSEGDPEPHRAPAPTPLPLPEAAFSLTLKGTLDGVEALLTARGATADEFRANLAAIRGLLDAKPQAPAFSPPPASAERRFCPLHGMEMQRHENAKGVWHSHFIDGRHCKGK